MSRSGRGKVPAEIYFKMDYSIYQQITEQGSDVAMKLTLPLSSVVFKLWLILITEESSDVQWSLLVLGGSSST